MVRVRAVDPPPHAQTRPTTSPTAREQEKEKKRREKKRAEQQALQERMQASAPPTHIILRMLLSAGFLRDATSSKTSNDGGMRDN